MRKSIIVKFFGAIFFVLFISSCEKNQTSDLAFFELKGPVLDVEVNGLSATVQEPLKTGKKYFFDSKGNWIISSYDGFHVERDKYNRIIKFDNGDEDPLTVTHFDYDDNGVLRSSSVGKAVIDYNRDEDGNTIGIHSYFVGVQGLLDETVCDFQITKYDLMGNWIERIDTNSGKRQRRSIEYYPLSEEYREAQNRVTSFIKNFYDSYVYGDKDVTRDLDILFTEAMQNKLSPCFSEDRDADDVWVWHFYASAQDGPSDVNKLIVVSPIDDDWYCAITSNMGNNAMTFIRVEFGKDSMKISDTRVKNL